MIHFPATIEVFICMVVSLLAAFVVGWLVASFLVGLVVGIGVFCFAVDALFSISIEEEDNEYY